MKPLNLKQERLYEMSLDQGKTWERVTRNDVRRALGRAEFDAMTKRAHGLIPRAFRCRFGNLWRKRKAAT